MWQTTSSTVAHFAFSGSSATRCAGGFFGPDKPLKIVAISDVHEKWADLELPPADLLIIAGDLCERRDQSFAAADAWVATVEQRFTFGALYVPGNHDAPILESAQAKKYQALAPHLFDVMLVDKTVEVSGLRIHGMPWDFADRETPEEKIPSGLDILVTHEPPQGILDWSARSPDDSQGNRSLRQRVAIVRPRLHIFGHCHMAYGVHKTPETTFINVAICGTPSKYYAPGHPATVIDGLPDETRITQ